MREEKGESMNEIQYNGFKVEYDTNVIRVIREVDLIGEKDTDIDKVTNYLEKKQKLKINWNETDCLIAYSMNGKNTEKIIKYLTELSIEEKESSISTEEATVDERMDVELEETTEKSMRELFGIKLSLPSYQRPYAWGRENIEFFWNDIRKSNEKYDYGIIVLLKNENGYYCIVDGQQRIVTISLMLCALESHEADSFINNTTLQGKSSKKNIGYNLQWLRRQSRKLSENECIELKDKILDGTVDIIVMDNLDDALKFFDRTNTTGVPLTATDILKSYHLQVLASLVKLPENAKERWKKSNFDGITSLDDINAFKGEVVRKWEGFDSWWLNKKMALMCALRMMAKSQWPGSIDDFSDIEQFRGGDNKDGVYTGLDSPIADGEFFFWYVFNFYKEYESLENEYKKGESHAARLKNLLYSRRSQEMFLMVDLYLREKYDSKSLEEQYNKVLYLVFSWLVYFCLSNDIVQFSTLRNSALEENSIFKAIVSSTSIEDCFDCYSENPCDRLIEEGRGDRVQGNGIFYLIRRELRRIYGEDDKNM